MTLNIFNTICFILALSALIKVFFGVFYHKALYDFARSHYSRPKMSIQVKLLMVYAFLLAIAAWIGIIFFYEPLGWILVALLTIASVKSLSLFFNWRETSRRFVLFINTYEYKLWMVDIFVAILGIGFLLMGFLIYS